MGEYFLLAPLLDRSPLCSLCRCSTPCRRIIAVCGSLFAAAEAREHLFR
jgi:hypothetical protein